MLNLRIFQKDRTVMALPAEMESTVNPSRHEAIQRIWSKGPLIAVFAG